MVFRNGNRKSLALNGGFLQNDGQMKKYCVLLIFASLSVCAQVGVNTTNPQALLDVPATNLSAPANTDGILIPRISAFPTVNPTSAQHGMLVFLTTASGANSPGFYYWDNLAISWRPVGGSASGTLDNAYDFGGTGSGKTITADAGSVLINGTDGLVSTGTLGVGAIVPSGAGTRMVWNPRKAAFRAGRTSGVSWDDALVGQFSAAFGEGVASGNWSAAFGASTATGLSSFAMGASALATGQVAIAMGSNAIASGFNSVSIGSVTTASGGGATAMGTNATASGGSSVAFGRFVSAPSFGETAFGSYGTSYTVSPGGDNIWNLSDRLFVIGNGLSFSNRSDAFLLLKNGLATLPSVTNTLIDAETTGKAIITKEWFNANNGGNLNAAYDFGGAGTGRTITADSGAVLIDGTDGITSTGTPGAGAIAIAGAGTRMFWNPRKVAFRSGAVVATEWNDANIGLYSSALGEGVIAPSLGETTIGRFNTSYTLGTNGMTTANATDRLFVVGNGTSNTTRSNAFVLLKNGLATLPSVTNALITADASGKSIVTKEWFMANGSNGTLNSSYNYGGAGAGRTITANAGALTINGTDGIVATGTFNSGAVVPSGAGTRMVWNPRKAAFRAGTATGTEWDDASVGQYSAGFGWRNIASGYASAAFGRENRAYGFGSTCFGEDTEANANNSFSFGFRTTASGDSALATGQFTEARGNASTSMGIGTVANEQSEVAIGNYNTDHDGRLFSIGNGTSNTTRNNVFAVYSDGRMCFGNGTPGGQFELSLNQGRKPGTSTWTITSDERLKTIHGNYTKGLSDILKLNPITYHYKNVGRKTFEPEVLHTEFSGFSAQQVQVIFPDAVGIDDDGYLNLNIHPILIASVNAFKELQQQNDALSAQNKTLTETVNRQQQMLEEVLRRLEKLETQNPTQ